MAITTDFTTLWFSHRSSNREPSANSEVARTGTIVMQTDENRCEFRKFDNDSGRMIVESVERCNNTVILDQHGVPVPLGTIHRLDAIGKSFGNAR